MKPDFVNECPIHYTEPETGQFITYSYVLAEN